MDEKRDPGKLRVVLIEHTRFLVSRADSGEPAGWSAYGTKVGMLVPVHNFLTIEPQRLAPGERLNFMEVV